MAKVTNGTNGNSDDSLDFEEVAPVGRKHSERTASAFVARQDVLDKLAPMLARSGAVSVKGTFATPVEAHKGAAFLLAHARILAEQMDPPKSAAVRLVDSTAAVVKASKDAPIPGNPPYTAIVELTHKRAAKTEAAAAEATPAA